MPELNRGPVCSSGKNLLNRTEPERSNTSKLQLNWSTKHYNDFDDRTSGLSDHSVVGFKDFLKPPVQLHLPAAEACINASATR